MSATGCRVYVVITVVEEGLCSEGESLSRESLFGGGSLSRWRGLCPEEGAF